MPILLHRSPLLSKTGKRRAAPEAVAIIPARGGSKRIPRKNIRHFAGQPLIVHPLNRAAQSGLFARIVVSTDDSEIAEVARAHGAEVPFLRAPGLADDFTGTSEVIADAVTRLALSAEVPVCCLYATAAFLETEDLQAGLALLQRSEADWVMAVTPFPAPIERSYRRSAEGLLQPRWPEQMPRRSQDFEPSYQDAGQFYWARASRWQQPDARAWDGAAGVEIPRERSVDIDSEADWRFAERLFAAMKRS